MTSVRPYCEQRTIPEAVAELRRGAGTQFDAAVVDALSELVVELLWPTATAAADTAATPTRPATGPVRSRAPGSAGR
jgi:HD-GYP domain-containing protein (c-di-GMP phosphodiesterase class II)